MASERSELDTIRGNTIENQGYLFIQSDLVQRTFRKTDNHDTADKHKTTDGFPIENCILGASEMRIPSSGQRTEQNSHYCYTIPKVLHLWTFIDTYQNLLQFRQF